MPSPLRKLLSLRSRLRSRATPGAAGLTREELREELAVLKQDAHYTKHELIQARRDLELLREAVGRVEARQVAAGPADAWGDAEFRAFSQSGEDGLLEHLIRRVPVGSEQFLEIGVENYTESNTRFLLRNRHWEGHIVEGAAHQVAAIRGSAAHSFERLSVYHEFVTRESINRILADTGLPEEFGLFSLDIDGNEFWVWREITGYRPTLCVVEYNWRYGPERDVVVPYDPAFVREKAHSSGSTTARRWRRWCGWAQHGYAFVGCNRTGVNAFFVRTDRLPDGLPERTAAEGYRPGTFSDFWNEQGEFLIVPPAEEVRFLAELDMPFVERPEV